MAAAFALDIALRRFLIADQLVDPVTFAFVVASFVDELFIPLLRVESGRIAFLCRHDALPEQGDVIGLAAPSIQTQLDAAV